MTIQTKLLNALVELDKCIQLIDDACMDWSLGSYESKFSVGESVPLMTPEQEKRYESARSYLLRGYNVLVPLAYRAPSK